MKCVVVMICETDDRNLSVLNIIYPFKNALPTKEEIAELTGKVYETYTGIIKANVLNIIPIPSDEESENEGGEWYLWNI